LPAMRRCASRWAMGFAASKRDISRMPRVSQLLKAAASYPQVGEGAARPAGWLTMARKKRTAQKPGRPLFLHEQSRSECMRGPRQTLVSDGSRDSGCSRAAGEENNPPRGRPSARGTGAQADGDEGVGEPHRSVEAGERLASGPSRAKAARVGANFRRGPCSML